MSFAVAVPKEKQAAMKYGIKTAGLLPYLMIISLTLSSPTLTFYSHFT